MPNSVILTEYLATLGIEAFALHVFFAKLKERGNATIQNWGMEQIKSVIISKMMVSNMDCMQRNSEFRFVNPPTEQLKHCEW